MTTVFGTERLLARRWTSSDAEAGFVIYGDPEVTRYVFTGGVAAPDVETVRQLMDAIAPKGREAGMGWLALVRRDDRAVIGSAVIRPIEDTGPEIEIGWHLARAHWGNGYAAESGHGLLRYGFDVLGNEALYALVHPDNARSIRVCERIGMRHLGRRRSDAGLDEEFFVAERATWTPPGPATR